MIKEKYINIVLAILQGLLASGNSRRITELVTNRVVDDAFRIADTFVNELNKRGYA